MSVRIISFSAFSAPASLLAAVSPLMLKLVPLPSVPTGATTGMNPASSMASTGSAFTLTTSPT